MNANLLVLSPLDSSFQADSFSSGEQVIDRQLRDYLAFPPNPELIDVTVAAYPADDEVQGYMALRLALRLNYGQLPKALGIPFDQKMEPALEVAFLGVTQAWRGKGLGRRLLGTAWALGKEAGFRILTLSALNDRLIQYYTSLGFVRVGYSMRMIARIQ